MSVFDTNSTVWQKTVLYGAHFASLFMFLFINEGVICDVTLREMKDPYLVCVREMKDL